MSTLLLAIPIGLLLFSSVLSAAVIAVFTIGDSRLRTLEAEGFQGAPALRVLRENHPLLPSSVKLASSVLNLTALGAAAAWGWVTRDALSAFLVTVSSVAVIALVGEIGPRAAAARWPIRIALLSARPLLALERLLGLALYPALRLEMLLGKASDVNGSVQEREVREISKLGREEGIVDADEHLLVERAFRLDELSAWDVMVPRVDIFSWKDSMRLGDIVDALTGVPYSRVPVYGDSIDDVTGVLYVREAYAAYVAGHHDSPLSALAREPFFVPGSLSLTQLLRDFQARRIHMGIVADEFGGTDGLVTLEDVLEELVGEIVDETDIAEEPLMRISRSELVADGSVDLREINYAFNTSLPQLEHRSLNGFILDDLGYVPARGESIERNGVQIEILDASETQVIRARLRKLATGSSPEDSEDD